MQKILDLKSVAYDKILDKYVADMTSVHPMDKHSTEELIPFELPEGSLVDWVALHGLDDRKSIAAFF